MTLTKDSKEIEFFNSMVYRTHRGFLDGDMTPIIIHKINKGE